MVICVGKYPGGESRQWVVGYMQLLAVRGAHTPGLAVFRVGVCEFLGMTKPCLYSSEQRLDDQLREEDANTTGTTNKGVTEWKTFQSQKIARNLPPHAILFGGINGMAHQGRFSSEMHIHGIWQNVLFHCLSPQWQIWRGSEQNWELLFVLVAPIWSLSTCFQAVQHTCFYSHRGDPPDTDPP